MLDRVVQERIGKRLRQVYGELPKGEIPSRIWELLLALERATVATATAQRA